MVYTLIPWMKNRTCHRRLVFGCHQMTKERTAGVLYVILIISFFRGSVCQGQVRYVSQMAIACNNQKPVQESGFVE